MPDPTTTDPDAAQQFLEDLFGDVDPDRHFLLWTLGDRRSHWQTAGDLAAAAAVAAEQAATHDVYVGVSTFHTALGPKARGEAGDSAGIVGLWADVDFADPVHKKADRLPPDERSASDLLRAMGLRPSIVVHSGHGLQAWWLFDEPWDFEQPSDHTEAADLARRWNDTLRVRAGERDWTVDSTFDLSRVMRLPGTVNWKGDPLPVRVADRSDLRYGHDDFDGYLADDSAVRTIGYRRVYTVTGLVLHPTRRPDVERLEILLEADPIFRKTWEDRRPELASPSERDLALASIAVRAGWSDQQITDLLIYGRHRIRAELKLRASYYGPTIAKARQQADRDDALEGMEETVAELDEAEASGDDEDRARARKGALDSLSKTLGVEVLRIVKYRGDPAVWRLYTPGGEITLGGADVLLNPKRMKQKLYEVAGVVLDNYSQPKWDKVAEAIERVVEVEEIAAEATDAGQVRAWLNDFLSARPPLGDKDEAVANDHPWRDGGDVVVVGSTFRTWLRMHAGERVSNKEMGLMMRVFGAENHQLRVTVRKKATTRSVWRFPWAEDQ